MTLLLGANAADDFKLKPVLTDHFRNPRALKDCARSALPVRHKLNNKAWMITHVFTTEYFKPTGETYPSEKRFLSKYECTLTMHLVHPGALMGTHSEADVIFMPVLVSVL